MLNILISIVCGFVGGLLGAMVFTESRTDDTKSQIQSLIDGHISIRSEIDKEKEKTSLIDHAVRVLALEQKRDRGQIWESLNALWNDYDQRQQRHALTQASEKTEKSKAKPKAKKEKETDKNVES